MEMLRKMLKINGELFDSKTDEGGHMGQSFLKENRSEASLGSVQVERP